MEETLKEQKNTTLTGHLLSSKMLTSAHPKTSQETKEADSAARKARTASCKVMMASMLAGPGAARTIKGSTTT